MEKRRVVATIIVNDEMAIDKSMSTIGYLEREFGWLAESDIYLEHARVIDDDDPYDAKAIEMVDKIFNDDVDDYEDEVITYDI